FFEGDTLFYQGTVLASFDAARMVRLLRVPAAKLARHGAATAAQRIVTLAELLSPPPPLVAVAAALTAGFAERLGIDFAAGQPSAAEEDEAARLLAEEIGTAAFVGLDRADERRPAAASATLAGAGGTIRLDLHLESAGAARIREVLFSGDFFATPPRAVLDLEAALRGVDPADARAVAAGFLARTPVQGLGPDVVDSLLAQALAAPRPEPPAELPCAPQGRSR
ncbi:MAG: hypothetical protein ACP5NI_06670, partial [Acetobacteraceae bacterium]